MKPEIVCALITLAGTVLSSVIAWFVSRSSAVKEIEKLRLTWQREDIVSSDDEFAEMVSAVARYLRVNNYSNYEDASAKVAAIRSKESGRLGELLDNLYDAVKSENLPYADDVLSKVIEEKRRRKSDDKTPSSNNPNR